MVHGGMPMDCKTARLLLEFSRPFASELPASELSALEQHLAACAECSQNAGSERTWDEHVATAMGDVPVPAGLRQRLHARLDSEMGRRRRQKVRRNITVVAAAAAVLLAVAFGWHWQR